MFCHIFSKQALMAAHICCAIDRCCAGNPSWQAAACHKWADAARDVLRLKISPSHLTLAARTRKCVWRPLVLSLRLPVTHTDGAQAQSAQHAVWLWQAASSGPGDLNRRMEQAGKTMSASFHTGIDCAWVRGLQLWLRMWVKKGRPCKNLHKNSRVKGKAVLAKPFLYGLCTTNKPGYQLNAIRLCSRCYKNTATGQTGPATHSFQTHERDEQVIPKPIWYKLISVHIMVNKSFSLVLHNFFTRPFKWGYSFHSQVTQNDKQIPVFKSILEI